MDGIFAPGDQGYYLTPKTRETLAQYLVGELRQPNC